MKDIEIALVLIMVAASTFGMWLHFKIAQKDGRIAGNFISYLFAENVGHTGLTFFAIAAIVGVALTSGVMDSFKMSAILATMKGGFFPTAFSFAIAGLVTAGYTADSMINKGAPSVP